jgi:putative methyltransferase (TIGR04325 family)
MDYIFEGVYSDAQSAKKALGDSLTSAYYSAESHLERQWKLFHSNTQSHFDLAVVSGRFTSLPWILATTSVRSVLDFGGGLGWVIQDCKEQLHSQVAKPPIDWTIVEAPEFIEAWANEAVNFPDAPRVPELLTFADVLAEPEATYDLFYSNSVLQYSGLSPLLQLLQHLKPEGLLLDDVIWSPSKSFFTTQNYYGKKQLHWIPNLSDLLYAFSEVGYKLTLHAPYVSIIRGVPSVTPPMSNLPLENQCPQSLTLLLSSVNPKIKE